MRIYDDAQCIGIYVIYTDVIMMTSVYGLVNVLVDRRLCGCVCMYVCVCAQERERVSVCMCDKKNALERQLVSVYVGVSMYMRERM